MIETFFGTDQLVMSPSAKTFLAALVIGLRGFNGCTVEIPLRI